MPSFKIWNAARSVRKAVQAHSVEELCQKGRQKLELKGALRIVLEADGTEIDEDEVLLDPEGPCAGKDVALILLQIGEKWRKEFLQEKPHEDSVSDSLFLLQAIKQHFSELRALIDSEFGLLEELLRLELLTEESCEDVRRKPNYFQKNDCLLDYIKLKSTEKELLDFLDALRSTDQSHVANFLLANGERLDIRYGLERPLGPQEKDKFKYNATYLLSKLDVTDELLSLLWQSRAITDQHMEHISSQGSINKITELVNIMKRRSFAAFKVFISALKETGQRHVADVLSKEGVIVPVHINITDNMPIRDIKAIEYDLVEKLSEFFKALSNGCTEKYDTLWADVKELFLQIELSGIRYKGSCQGNSITVFFWCRDRHAMSRLLQMLESGKLEKMFQQTLTLLADKVLSFSLKINKQEWKLAECYFQVSDEPILTSFRVPTVVKATDESRISPLLEHKIFQQNSLLDILPKELMEMILMQTLVSYVRLPRKASVPPVGYQTFMLMASVCQEWRNLLTSRTWFSSTMKTYLKKNKHLAVLQEHHSIFDQCLEVDCAFLWEMSQSNLLADEQVLEIGSEPDHLKQMEQLFFEVFLHFSAESYTEFYKVLRNTSQGHIANYLEANGVIDLSRHDEWPLDDESKARLDSAQSRLGDFVPSDEFLDALKTINCITKIHADGISSLPDGQKLNELMRVLRKRSFAAYRQFAAHLRKLYQFADVAEILASSSDEVDPMDVDEPRENPEVSPDVSGQVKESDEVPDLKAVELALAEKLLEVGKKLLEGHPLKLHQMNQIRTLWFTLERLQQTRMILAKDPEATEIHDVGNLRMTDGMSESKETASTPCIENKKGNTALNDLCDEQSPICETTGNFNLGNSKHAKCLEIQSYTFGNFSYQDMIKLLLGYKLEPSQAIRKQQEMSEQSCSGDVQKDGTNKTNQSNYVYKSDFAMSLVAMHNRIDCSTGSGDRFSSASEGYYTRSVKDIYTIVWLHLVVYVIFAFVWDLISINRPGFSRKKLLFYSTSALMLMSCLVFDVIAVTKEGSWTAFPFWWNELPFEIMSFYEKLYFLVQTALLCYFLETLCFSGQSITSMLDSWIDGTLNLVFSIICYVHNLLPLMMVIFALRFLLQTGVSLVQVMSLLELSEKQSETARSFCRALRWLTGGEVICYASLIAANIIYGSHSIDKQVFILVPLCAMLGVSTFRVASSRKFDLDLIRDGHVDSLGPLSTGNDHVNDRTC